MDHPVEHLRPVRRGAHQPLHVRIAADHPVERDDVGGGKLLRELHEVPVEEGHPLAVSPLLGLGAGGLQVRRRDVDGSRPGEAVTEELVGNGAHPAPDVQQRPVPDALRSDPLQ